MEWWGFPNDAMKWIVVLAVVVSLAFAVVLLSRGYKALRSRRERKRIVPPEARRENKAPASAAPELSGRAWVERFPGSKSVDDLEPNFRRSVKGFLKALADAGADVTISATFRPPERAYLMHYAWEIAHEEQDARHVPHMPDVNIEWAHDTNAASRDAALEMVDDLSPHCTAVTRSGKLSTCRSRGWASLVSGMPTATSSQSPQSLATGTTISSKPSAAVSGL